MPVTNESLLQEKKRLVKAAQRIKKTAVAKRRTAVATRPKLPKNLDWLTKPVKRYKLVGGKTRRAIPQARKPLIPITPKLMGLGVSHHVTGNVPGTAGISWIPVISSNVAAYAYDAAAEECHCAFLDGSHYVYYDFPEELFMRWTAAPSKGIFLWQNIRDRFPYDKLS